jgi:hypothetical protein
VCTVSWTEGLDTFELFSNRDEQRTRPSALPPSTWTGERGGRFLAPIDSAAQGTWISVNEHGVALCLLNHYQAQAPRTDSPKSRGWIVRGLADAGDAFVVRQALEEEDLSAYPGFRLLVLQPGEPARLAHWDGVQFAWADQVRAPLISSGYALERVTQSRLDVFRQLEAEHGGVSPEMLAAYHQSELPEPGPLAVNMSREDARTVSLTTVRVSPETVELTYYPGPPAEDPPALTHRLKRVGALN